MEWNVSTGNHLSAYLICFDEAGLMNILCDLISISQVSSSQAWDLTRSRVPFLCPPPLFISLLISLIYSPHSQRLRAELIKNTGCGARPSVGAAEIQSLVGVIRDGVKEAAGARRGLKSCG